MPRPAIEQEEVAGAAAHERRAQDRRRIRKVARVLEDLPFDARGVDGKLQVVARSTVQHARLERAPGEHIQHGPAEKHVTVAGEHVLAGGAADADVLRHELEILEPRIERQRVVIGAIDGDPAKRAPVAQPRNRLEHAVDE